MTDTSEQKNTGPLGMPVINGNGDCGRQQTTGGLTAQGSWAWRLGGQFALSAASIK